MRSAFSGFYSSIKRLKSLYKFPMNPIDHFSELIRRSAKKQTDFLEKFLRENKQFATWFNNDICKFLRQRGWYVAGTLTLRQCKALKEAIKQDQEAEIEDFLVRHVRSNTEQTAFEALAKWPNRRKILTDAFDAHSKALYTLSVPVMLAQADGITHEIFGVSLFRKKIGTKARKAIARNMKQDPLGEAFLRLLTKPSGLQQSTRAPDKQKGAGDSGSLLNRHGVLHGIDCDYPTECNSLRAIALINFLSWVDESIDRNCEGLNKNSASGRDER